MRNINITQSQSILNKAISLTDFTVELKETKRFIIGSQPLYIGKNPSTRVELLSKITEAIDSGDYDSIGGWKSQKGTQMYFIDANVSTDSLEEATEIAEQNREEAIWDSLEQVVIQIEDKEISSNCCGAETYETDMGICPDCLEHCEFN